MSKGFKDLLQKVYECDRKTVAVAVAEDEPVLEAVQAAKEKGIADAILVGDEAKIREIAAGMNMDLTGFEIINETDHVQAAHTAVKLVHDGRADMYMKGLIDTKNFLKSVLDKEVGLRTGRALSHVCVFEIKGIDRLLFLSDVAFMTYPTLEDKVAIINNTVEVCHACGIANPKVAPVAAVEVVNPKMPCTVDADELHGYGDRQRRCRAQGRNRQKDRRGRRRDPLPGYPCRKPRIQGADTPLRCQERQHPHRYSGTCHPDIAL